MKIVNMHDAKTQLSKLVEAASTGEGFIIARAGTPLVKVVRHDAELPRRLGFMQGQYHIPEDFDLMAEGGGQGAFRGRAGGQEG